LLLGRLPFLFAFATGLPSLLGGLRCFLLGLHCFAFQNEKEMVEVVRPKWKRKK
jgi:hypothetical protein